MRRAFPIFPIWWQWNASTPGPKYILDCNVTGLHKLQFWWVCDITSICALRQADPSSKESYRTYVNKIQQNRKSKDLAVIGLQYHTVE
jgi:hypothetical protein